MAANIADASARLKIAETKEEFFAVINEVDEIMRKILHAEFILGTRYYHDASDLKMAV